MQFSIWIEILGSTQGILALTCPGNNIGNLVPGCMFVFSHCVGGMPVLRGESEALEGGMNC